MPQKSSPQTTWYIFFEEKGKRILIKHISNNWTGGNLSDNVYIFVAEVSGLRSK